MPKNIVLLVRPSSIEEALGLKLILEKRMAPCMVSVFTNLHALLRESFSSDWSIVNFLIVEGNVPLLGHNIEPREVDSAIKFLREETGLQVERWEDTYSIKWFFNYVTKHTPLPPYPVFVFYDEEASRLLLAGDFYCPVWVIKKSGRPKKKYTGELIQYIKNVSKLRKL